MASTFEALLLAQVGYLMSNAVQPISKQTLVSPAAAVTFSNIPQTYSHLLLISRAKSASTATNFISDNLALQFNGVTSASYNTTAAFATQAGTVLAGFASAKTYLELGAIWTSFSPNTAGSGNALTLIANYTDTSFAKSAVSLSYASDGGTSADVHIAGGALLASVTTAAVTSIAAVTVSGANFTVGTSLELLGVP